MNEIYWITRLDGICLILGIIIAICIVMSVISFFIWTDSDSTEKEGKYGIRTMKVCIPLLLITSILKVLTPTTKDALIIYGVGGSLEYIKSNDKIKQLPDKCVDAIDMFIDKYLKEDK